MADHIANRDIILEDLSRELLGPAPAGKSLDSSANLEEIELSYGPYFDETTGEEILTTDTPTKRYGVGVLHPFGTREERLDEAGIDSVGHIASGQDDGTKISEENSKFIKSIREIEESARSVVAEDSLDDHGLLLGDTYKPSSMGISFLVRGEPEDKLEMEFSGGRYVKLHPKVNGKKITWWLRKPIFIKTSVSISELVAGKDKVIRPQSSPNEAIDGLSVGFEILSRTHDKAADLLITVTFVNRSEFTWTDREEKCIFQSRFKARLVSKENTASILPYPSSSENVFKEDREEQSINLLYRNFPVFCVGHGCAGNWERIPGELNASTVSADPLPIVETPSVTPEILDEAGEVFEIPMGLLTELETGEGINSLKKLVSLYDAWIEAKGHEARGLRGELKDTAERHLGVCANSSARMKRGIEVIENDPISAKAFQLANLAILIQQNLPKAKRSATLNSKSRRIEFPPYGQLDLALTDKLKGSWRPFQVAFLLLALASVAQKDDPERELVELLWFPTGGGKTEAYLALAAFSLFRRRLTNPEDIGVDVIMRYTLRLLTTQQFQRASRVILAMEFLRKNNPELGAEPFSIGLWVGETNTPNTRDRALKTLRDISSGKSSTNRFVLDQCPWCGAEIGPIRGLGPIRALGLEQHKSTVRIKCPDTSCFYAPGLPIYVVDEDIYSHRPSIVIGTVDKFAMLAWRPEARSIFGVEKDGSRHKSPPNLILQDELHLISGPLGSLVGLYEVLIEELCTDRRDKVGRPKIIASTATIRSYESQVLGLYGRKDAALFPPPGISVEDSFFSKYAISPNGGFLPGRKYVGIYAPGLGSMQTVQVRTFTAMLQAPLRLQEHARDPWWTLLVFFNSLRELGTTLSLFQSDILDYQKVLLNRSDLSLADRRRILNPIELTGRARDEDIPKALLNLGVSYLSKKPFPIDVCLASSILEVGIDIDRLSLMAVVGQPKTTSQYIQVTGRVGRSWKVRPGLVVTLYGASKPRDRSHFEQFRSYHERLYAQVEPTSVTPFSPPALDRALHGVIAAYVRQLGDNDAAQSPYPFPAALIDELKAILLPRIEAIDIGEREYFLKIFERRQKEWENWGRTKWTASWTDEDVPLMRGAGSYVPSEKKMRVWETLRSLRSVDQECVVEISDILAEESQENAE